MKTRLNISLKYIEVNGTIFASCQMLTKQACSKFSGHFYKRGIKSMLYLLTYSS